MPEYFFEGILLGLIISVSLGPVLFTIVETGLTYSSKMAMVVAVGVLTSDIILVIAGRFFSEIILLSFSHIQIIKIFAGIFFVGIGVFKLSAKGNKFQTQLIETHPYGYFQYFVKGFVINGLNPAVFIFWMTIVSVYEQKENSATLSFFIGVFSVTFSMDLVKSIFAEKLNKYMTIHSIRFVGRITGIVFIAIGFWLIIGQLNLDLNPPKNSGIFQWEAVLYFY